MKFKIDKKWQHVYPVNDLKPHITDGSGECWCDQEIDEDLGIIIHSSADRREDYEQLLH